jgi:multidrug efflux pump subunit AcrA (membrane-fusion protein)
MKATWMLVVIAILSVFNLSCSSQNNKDASQAQTQSQKVTTAVDVAIASLDLLQTETEFTGTTAPIQEVSVRSRIEGRLLELNVDIGDRVNAGQAIAQLDDAVLSATVLQADAEVAAREAEVSQANAAVGNARAQVERARLQYQQAQADANRFMQLAKEGAVAPQTAENAITQARTAEQSLRAAEQQVSLQEQAVGVSSQRVLAQEALRLREQERQTYTTITSPINGIVLERVSEAGNLLFAGNEVLKLGDFSQVKVVVQISELKISQIRLNQSVNVRFDGFPNQNFVGTVRRISPVADPIARLIPVEIALPNRDQKLGGGQLARVQFSGRQEPKIVISETALESRPQNQSQKQSQKQSQNKTSDSAKSLDLNKPKAGTVFVVTGDKNQPKVSARQVSIGDRRDGKVVILSGLKEGDRVVVRSGGKLQDGDSVRISALSEN